MAASLPRPGVEVVQVFQTVTPTVITPTLVPCVVGKCMQVVDVLETTATGASTLNSEALVSMQAALIASAATGTPPVYAGLDGLDLILSLNEGPPFTVTFSGTPLTPEQVVAEVQNALGDAGIETFTAQVYKDEQWTLTSETANAYQSIEVLSGTDMAVLDAFGFAVGRVSQGSAYYDQHGLTILSSSFPNPNNNLEYLVVDPTTVRAFLFMGSTGSTLQELRQTEAFLQAGTATAASVTGSAALSGLSFALPATTEGTADVTSAGLYGPAGTLSGKTFTVSDDGAAYITVTFDGSAPTPTNPSGGNSYNQANLFAYLAAMWPGIEWSTTVLGGGGAALTLTDILLGASSTFTIEHDAVNGTANAIFGFSHTADTVAAGTAGTLDGETLIMSFNGSATPLTVTFGPAPDLPTTLAQINNTFTGYATAASSSGHLKVTTTLTGEESEIAVGSGTANATFGLSASVYYGSGGVSAVDSGNGTSLTSILAFSGTDFTVTPGSAKITGTSALTSVENGHTLIIDDGYTLQTVAFASAVSPSAIVSQINAVVGPDAGGHIFASLNGSNDLVLTSYNGENELLGAQATILVSGGTATTELGLSASVVGSRVWGSPYQPKAGDNLYIDGIFFATITSVCPGGNVNQLKINTQVPVATSVGTTWYIVAENLDATADTAGITRPFPNLIVDELTGDLLINSAVVRNTLGTAVYPTVAQIYVQYQALRLDVTPQAAHPGLLSFQNTTDLANQIPPVDTTNPLALGAYFALLNAPGTIVTALGIDAYTEDEPWGTVEAFTTAATFLESYEVYVIAPLTHDSTVFGVFQTHVDFMSEPVNKGERIVLINPSMPEYAVSTLVASSPNGNSAPTPDTFDTSIHNLDALLLARGEPAAGPYEVSDGIYLDIGDGYHYCVYNVIGTVVYLKTSGFLPGQNDDGFYYAAGAFPAPPTELPLISKEFSIYIRGAELVLSNGLPDYQNIAVAVQTLAKSYADRRVWSTFPDQTAATINGTEQLIDGFYLNAAVAGMIGQQPPQQSFTNYPMTGFTRVIGSNSVFSEAQLNIIAAGGVYIIVQDTAGAPLMSRMALTTDMTSVETRTDSITKVVDFTAKFERQCLKAYIGRFNITQGFLDTLGHVIQGVSGFLVESGVLIGSSLNNIVQDTAEPDQVDIDQTLDVPFPCNYIRLVLTV